MSWLDLFRAKLTTAEEAVLRVKSGERIYCHAGCAVPLTLVQALLKRAPELFDVEILHMLTFGRRTTRVRSTKATSGTMACFSAAMYGRRWWRDGPTILRSF